MVLILTLNPSIDLLYFEKTFQLGAHNRFNNSTIMPAGKGINCARALSYLGEIAETITVVAGTNGEYFKTLLKKEKFSQQFITVEGETRHAITIMHDDNIHTEIVEAGPKVSTEQKELIFQTILDTIIKKNIRIISLNGSVHSDDPYFYNDLLTFLRKNTAPDTIILGDFSRQTLDLVVNHAADKPDFIKPNMDEFSELVGTTFTTKQEIIEYLRNFPSPIRYTLVSCGEQGAVAQFNNKLYDVSAPRIELVNPTGSGDSTVAGAIYAFKHHLSDEEFLKYAIASGTANAMESGVGVIAPSHLEMLFENISINPL
ncbi:1-phosphofructokinase family hexose kinase [Streptococcus gallolyticus]|uniref:1-phosphofructokinase family hexose kinase n=1 Tax=Streptococcus hepaticus TaxID=3349163 RepID=UPI001C93A111|nr:1-phosphofructokinase family hexose kinase [Streptococcus gallolyticus]MBY5040360.1 1-phosphofructokinase family hexose kinase [Streptococcus gallolyticus]